jgi:uncharacterized protein YigA (DUF484 family)
MDFSISTILIVLISLSILLFVLSFFKKDRVTELEKQMEALTIQMMQENYQLKKRLKVLEEELLGTHRFPDQDKGYKDQW